MNLESPGRQQQQDEQLAWPELIRDEEDDRKAAAQHLLAIGSSSSSGSMAGNGPPLPVGASFSSLHHYVSPHNLRELHVIHRGASSTAIYYTSCIFALYLLGLVIVLVQYMNTSYGRWNWTLTDIWEEVKPAVGRTGNQQPQNSSTDNATGSSPNGPEAPKRARNVNQNSEEEEDDDEEDDERITVEINAPSLMGITPNSNKEKSVRWRSLLTMWRGLDSFRRDSSELSHEENGGLSLEQNHHCHSVVSILSSHSCSPDDQQQTRCHQSNASANGKTLAVSMHHGERPKTSIFLESEKLKRATSPRRSPGSTPPLETML